jgi:hypothetical protein
MVLVNVISVRMSGYTIYNTEMCYPVNRLGIQFSVP